MRAVAWDPDMSDAVTKRAGSKKIYDTRVANKLIADVLVVSDRFAASNPQTVMKFIQGWLEGVAVHPSAAVARLHPDRHHQGFQHSRRTSPRPCSKA